MKADTIIKALLIAVPIWFAFVGFIFGQASSSHSYVHLVTIFAAVAAPIATLAAAFAGSRYAFKLNNEQTKRDRDLNSVEAANNTIFELMRWYSTLHGFKTQALLEHQDSPARHYLILPTGRMASSDGPKIDYNSLSFVFKSTNPDTLGNLSIVEQRIVSVIDSIQQRSRLHDEVVQPAVEALERKGMRTFDIDQLNAEIGPRYSQTIEMMTNDLYSSIDETLERIAKNIAELKDVTLSVFPGHVVIGMVPKEETSE